MLNYTKRESILQDDHSTENIKYTDISLMVRGTPAHVKCYSYLGMLIPGYLDTRVPCGLPGSRPGSRETSDLPSYRDRLHQSTMQHAKRGSPPTQFTVVPYMLWSGCKLAGADTVYTFIYVRQRT